MELFVTGTAVRLATQLIGVHRNTAAFYFHRLRKIIYYRDEEAGLFEGEIEADESYFGSQRKGKRSVGVVQQGKFPFSDCSNVMEKFMW